MGKKFRGKVPNTLLCILAVRGTAKIHARIQESMATIFALAGRIILEELYLSPAFGAFGLENGPRLPITTILSRAFQ